MGKYPSVQSSRARIHRTDDQSRKIHPGNLGCIFFLLTRVKPLICFTNNPDTQRIMRLLYYNAISLYRYADGRITGHFNINALFTLIILDYIDLDSIIVAKELFKHNCEGEL